MTVPALLSVLLLARPRCVVIPLFFGAGAVLRTLGLTRSVAHADLIALNASARIMSRTLLRSAPG